MDVDIATAHRLAHFIEWTYAQSRARASRMKTTPQDEFDPLTATCLGDLIYDVARTGKFNVSIRAITE